MAPREARGWTPMLDIYPIRTSSQAGYTLLEIMVVLLLMGVIGATVLPRVDVIYDNLVLRSDREQLLHAIGSLPLLAMTRRETIVTSRDSARLPGLLEVPEGWSVSFPNDMTIQPTGFCTGGTVVLSHSSERSWSYRMKPPFCAPEEFLGEG